VESVGSYDGLMSISGDYLELSPGLMQICQICQVTVTYTYSCAYIAASI
jgi:hypothetical protein